MYCSPSPEWLFPRNASCSIPFRAATISVSFVDCYLYHYVIPENLVLCILLLPMVPSLGTRRTKSITVQTAPVLRRSHRRAGYALRLERKPKRLGSGWRGIVHKPFSRRNCLIHGQFTTTHQHSLSAPFHAGNWLKTQ